MRTPFQDGESAARNDLILFPMMQVMDNEPKVTGFVPQTRMWATGYRIAVRMAVETEFNRIMLTEGMTDNGR